MTFASQPYITATGFQRFANVFTASTLTSSRLKQALAEGANRNTPHYGGYFGSDDMIITNNKPKKQNYYRKLSCFLLSSIYGQFTVTLIQHSL